MIPGRLRSLHDHLQPHTSQQLRTSLDAAVLGVLGAAELEGDHDF